MKQTFYVGMDVSKGYADVLTLDQNKKTLEKSFQLDDNRIGHQHLEAYVLNLSQKGNVICGLENTGGYERNWVFGLSRINAKKKNSIEVFRLNPKAVKHQMQSLLKRTITDSVSAEGIAMFMANNYELMRTNWQNSMDKKEKVSACQQLHKMIMSLLKQQTMKKNQLEKLLYAAFPESLAFSKSGYPQWFLRMLEQYPTSAHIKRATIKGLVSIKGLSDVKARELKTRVESTVACLNDRITTLMVRQQSKDILHIEKEIKTLKAELVTEYGQTEDLKIVNSVKGIADWSATAFLIQLGDYHRFEDTNQLASFFGIHPIFKQSGDGKYKSRMSKQGSSAMRAILFVMANNMVIHNPYFKSIYAKHKAKGKHHRAAIGVIMHKLLRVLFGMLKSQKDFNQQIDIANQEKQSQKDQSASVVEISKEARRKQELTTEAPVSRSNYKKRRAALEHQSSIEDDKTVSSNKLPLKTNIKNV